jgi:hypothetical protein
VLNKSYPRRNKLDGLVDANLGGDAFSEHSRSCYVIMLNGGIIKMKVMKQTTVSRSTGHSEMQALVLLVQSLQVCRDLLAELGYMQGCVRICEDNSACVLQSGGDHQAARSGHYRRDQAAVDEVVNAGKVFVDKIDSAKNYSDLGTKSVKPIELFEFLRDRMTGYDTGVEVTPTVQKAIDRVLLLSRSEMDQILGSDDDGSYLGEIDTNATKKGATKLDYKPEPDEGGFLMQRR